MNGNACVFRYFSTGQSFCSIAFSFRTDHYTVDQFSDAIWSKVSSKHLTVPDHDRFLTQPLSFKKDEIFLTLSSA